MIQYRKSIILPLLKNGHRDSRFLVGMSEPACRQAGWQFAELLAVPIAIGAVR